jgi:hypothetical protein
MPLFQESELIKAIEIAESLYYRLVLVVGPPKAGKTQLLKMLNQHAHNVNLVLSSAMLNLPLRRRPLESPRLFSDMITAVPTSPVVLDNLELLFDTSLKLDPLACLKQASRNCTIAASFPGVFEDGHLIYAEAQHPEYRRFPADDLLIVNLSPTPAA